MKLGVQYSKWLLAAHSSSPFPTVCSTGNQKSAIMADTDVDYVKTSHGILISVPRGVTLRHGKPSDLESVKKLSRDMNMLDGGDYMPGLYLGFILV